MSLGYLIVAHHRPQQLLRLVHTIRRWSIGPIVIHIDRSARAAFVGVERALQAAGAVEIVSAEAVRWAHFSQVRAELAGLAKMLERFDDVTHIQHLTGQDYPIRPLADFEATVLTHPGRSLLDCVALPAAGFEALWEHIAHAHWVGPMRRVLRVPWARRLPAGRRFFAGSPYWCLARDHARHLIDLPAPAQRFYHAVLSSDEVFFQTELVNSAYAGELVQADWTWTDWPGDSPSPEILTMRHQGALAQRGEFFARKFDERVDAAILDWLDVRLAGGTA